MPSLRLIEHETNRLWRGAEVRVPGGYGMNHRDPFIRKINSAGALQGLIDNRLSLSEGLAMEGA